MDNQTEIKTTDSVLESVIKTLDDYFQEANADTPERIKRIKSVQDFLAYTLRLTELSEVEKADFVKCMEGGIMTENMRKKLDDCKDEKQKDYYLDMWARSTYFRRCAWLGYLHGEPNSIKPTVN